MKAKKVFYFVQFVTPHKSPQPINPTGPALSQIKVVSNTDPNYCHKENATHNQIKRNVPLYFCPQFMNN